MELNIIIPLFNEALMIPQVLEEIKKVNFPGFLDEISVIIVNDCSTDSSLEAVQEYIRSNPGRNTLLNLPVNSGKGAAVRKGIECSSGEIILIQDADLELSPADIPVMLLAMKELNVEFINGSRYLPGVTRPLSSYRRYLANRFFTWLTSVLINVKLTDVACGYKLFTRSLYEQMSLRENRFGFEAELIIKSMRIRKNNIAEVPVKYFPRNEGEGKKFRNTDAFKMLITIFKYAVLKKK